MSTGKQDMPDHYEGFAALASSETEGHDYTRRWVDRGSDIVVIAPHGGGIEQGTSEIAEAVAGEAFSLYCFGGTKRTGNRRLHMASTRFDEPSGVALMERSRVVVAIHGLRGEDEAVYVGGLDHELKTRLLDALNEAGFEAREARSPSAGTCPSNACNRGSTGQGVQLELTWGLRTTMFQALDRRGRRTPKPAFHRLVGAIRRVLDTASPSDTSTRGSCVGPSP